MESKRTNNSRLLYLVFAVIMATEIRNIRKHFYCVTVMAHDIPPGGRQTDSELLVSNKVIWMQNPKNRVGKLRTS